MLRKSTMRRTRRPSFKAVNLPWRKRADKGLTAAEMTRRLVVIREASLRLAAQSPAAGPCTSSTASSLRKSLAALWCSIAKRPVRLLAAFGRGIERLALALRLPRAGFVSRPWVSPSVGWVDAHSPKADKVSGMVNPCPVNELLSAQVDALAPADRAYWSEIKPATPIAGELLRAAGFRDGPEKGGPSNG